MKEKFLERHLNTSFLPFSFSVEMGKTEEIYKFLPHTVGKKSFIDTWIAQKSLKFAKMAGIMKEILKFLLHTVGKKGKNCSLLPNPFTR